MRRFTAFIAVIVVSFAVIAWTTPGLVKNIKLGLDLKGGFEILYVAEPVDTSQHVTKDVLRQAARSLEHRADATGVTEPEVTPEGSDRIRVRLAGVANQEEVRQILKKPAQLTFRSDVGCEEQQPFCNVEMTGADFVEGAAKVQFDGQTNAPIVAIKVKDAKKFEEVTRKLLHKQMAIYLDDQLISAPTVQSILPDGTAVITGQESYEEAQSLADTINLGALPVNLTEIYTQSVGASLGKQSLDQTLYAGILSSIFVVLFMVLFYRMPGVISIVTLVTYTWLLLLITYWMNATLTLPGIAAFVLGVGMAVDANIITAERIKEELRSGKTLLSSLKAGSRNSFRAIIDANVTTILAGAVLYMFGTGSIKGFALILILSIIVSIITNVYLAKFLLELLVRSRLVRKVFFYGVKEAEVSEL